MSSLIRDLASKTPEMLEAFSDESLLRAALAFEAALATSQAAEGLISERDAGIIAEACVSIRVDIAGLAQEAAHAGTLAIPLVKHLRTHVAAHDPAVAQKIHMGATSQDVADTALMLQVKAGAVFIERDLLRLSTALENLARIHMATPMLGRTLLQGALPITFGLRAVNWLSGIDAALARFQREREGALALQFGGAAGSLAGLGAKAFAVMDRMARDLGLACPPMSWHSRRDGIAGVAASLGVITGAVAKIARDLSLMAQGEVGEAFEPRVEGRGGSSAMAHKRNPTNCQSALSAAARVPGLVATILAGLPQEYERGLGGWQAEGAVLADLFGLSHGAVLLMAPVMEGLEIDTAAMARNLAAANVGYDTAESANIVRRALDQRGKR